MNYLMHHGVKGMKWGIRKDPKPGSKRAFKKEFKNDRENFRKQFTEEGWKKFDKNNYRKRIDEIDEYARKHGSSYGDYYSPNWQSIKKNDKTSKLVKEYSRLVDTVYGDGTSDSIEAKVGHYESTKTRSALKAKYGTEDLKQAWKLNKKAYKEAAKSNKTKKGQSVVKKALKKQINKQIEEQKRRDQIYEDYKRNRDRYDKENEMRNKLSKRTTF